MVASFVDRDLDSYTDEELAAYVRQAPNILTIRKEAIRILSPCLVAKSIHWPDNPWDEVRAMERAANAGIRVPTVRRVVSSTNNNYVIIMDRVVGQTLEQLWPVLGFWQTLRIGWELRRVVACMRSVKSQSTGGLHTGKVVSNWIQGLNMPIPHATPAAFTDYLNWWLVRACPSVCTPRPELILQTPSHHVLVHQDLVPRNILVDDSFSVWIVDWGIAGYFPAFMEGLAMRDGPYSGDHELVASTSWSTWWGRLRWTVVRLLACGWHFRYKKQWSALATVGHRSNRFRLERPINSSRY